MATHPDIKDKDLRAILANELLILHKRAKLMYTQSELFCIRIGLYTALRRVQFAREGVTK